MPQPTKTVDGVAIPLLGFGTWQLEPADARRMVAEALRIGYRHIDTARIYNNEEAVGQGVRDAIAEGGVDRDEIFLTTKIWHDKPDGAAFRAAFAVQYVFWTIGLIGVLRHRRELRARLARDGVVLAPLGTAVRARLRGGSAYS